MMDILKNIFVSLFLLTGTKCAAQKYFNQLIDYNTQNYEGLAQVVQLKDSGYFSVGISWSLSNGYNHYTVRIDKKGNKLSERYIEVPYLEIPLASLVLYNDSTLYVAGAYIESSGSTRYNRDVFLAKVKLNGDTIWTKRYGLGIGTVSNPDQEGNYNIIKSQDGGLVILGYSDHFAGNNWQVYLIKVDSSGNLLWQKSYGGNATDVAYSIIETADKGFLLAGYTLSYGAGDRDGYLIKTDSLGNFQWQKTFGNAGTDGLVGISKVHNGNYILSGWTNTVLSSPNQNKFWLMKIDENGNLIWDKKYGNSKSHGSLYNSVELNDSNIVVFGSVQDTLGMPYSGLLLRTTKNGDSLWAREYKRSTTQDDYFNGFCTTNDGGFIMAGQVSAQATPSGTQDAWLVKVDCNGADSITHYFGDTCYIGNPSLVNEKNEVDVFFVYPNPVRDIITIKSNRLNTDDLKVIITDVLGNQILFEIDKSNEVNQINFGNLANGIYFLHFNYKGQLLETKKIIKQ